MKRTEVHELIGCSMDTLEALPNYKVQIVLCSRNENEQHIRRKSKGTKVMFHNHACK